MSKIPQRPKGGKRTPFYWWRRFRSHKYLPYKSKLIAKIQNGDFECPALFEHAKWELHWMKEDKDKFIQEYQGYGDPKTDELYRDIERRYQKRYNKLYEDACDVENRHLQGLVEALSNEFHFTKDKISKWMETFDGTTEQLYYYCAEKKGMNINSKKILDNSWK